MVLLSIIGQKCASCFSSDENQLLLIQLPPLTQTPWGLKHLLLVVDSRGKSSFGTMQEQSSELTAWVVNSTLQVSTMFFSTLDNFKDRLDGKWEGVGEPVNLAFSKEKLLRPFLFLVSYKKYMHYFCT